MPRKKLPANLRLDVSLLRAIYAMRSALDTELENNPGLPNPIVELDDALETVLDEWHKSKDFDYLRILVKYHEVDFTL